MTSDPVAKKQLRGDLDAILPPGGASMQSIKDWHPDVMEFIKKHYHPLDIVFRLAEDHGIVLLNGGGFAAPNWSVRISLANLENHTYDDIGRALRAIARGYRATYEEGKGKNGNATGKKAPKAKR